MWSAILLAGFVAGCTTPGGQTPQVKGFHNAREQLLETVAKADRYTLVLNINQSFSKAESPQLTITPRRLVVTKPGTSAAITFADLNFVTVRNRLTGTYVSDAEWADGPFNHSPLVVKFGCTVGPEISQPIADAINALISGAKTAAAEYSPAAFESFRSRAMSWRRFSPKPPLPMEAERQKVLAEDAAREKRFAEAAEHYEQALKVEPCWPDGQFNCAQIDAALEEYANAAFHMKCYLCLAPEASDAEDSRQKMIIWEEKAK